MLDATALARVLTDRFGLALRGEARQDQEGHCVRLLPVDVASTQGFSMEILLGWRSIEASFCPGAYASALVAAMQKASGQQWAVFRTFMQAIHADSGTLEMSINGIRVEPAGDSTWPADWRSLSIRLRRSPLVIDHKDVPHVQNLVATWAGRLLGLTIALLPTEQEEGGEIEGGFVRVEVNRHERSPVNRAACIEIHGPVCKACGTDLGTVYGDVGAGFIEVHHIEPISSIPAGTIVDPARDLIPLCPNCHAIAHRRKPPFSVDELRAMIRTSHT